MAVMQSIDGVGWLIDEETFYRRLYGDLRVAIKSDLLNLREPFRMDSELLALKREATGEKQLRTSRKRKRQQRQVELDGRLCEMVSAVSSAFDRLMEAASGYFEEAATSVLSMDNNAAGRAAAHSCLEASAQAVAAIPPSAHLRAAVDHAVQLRSDARVESGQMYENASETPIWLRRRFLIPPRSSFLIGDVDLVRQMNTTFDVILMDPPWTNKSVKRKKTYWTFDERDLLRLPVEQLLRPDGLVIIWVSNKAKLHEFIRSSLLPKWNLREVAMWFWLKVTTSGQPVYPLGSDHFKQPFEPVIFACRADSRAFDAFPNNRLVVSVPSAVHSRKPPLQDVLALSGVGGDCLELFARYLLPKTLSVGNEAIRLQHASYFTCTNDERDGT